MPTYEYRCSNCGHLLEAFQRMSDAPLTHCPNCDKEELKRVVSGGAGVIYRGEGWYVTDYSKKSSGGKDEPSISASKAASKDTAAPKSEPAAPSPKPEKP
jgi:putative FmdB family regulatory protein